MGEADTRRPLDELSSPRSILSPKSIAIVGASERGRWPSLIHANLKSCGFPGNIYLINPRQKEVYGQPTYPSLRDVPGPVEHAMVIVPAAAVPGVLEDAEAAGVGSATVYAAGLGDGDDPASKDRGVWLGEFLTRAKIRLCGPNCMGAMSYKEKLIAYPNTALAELPAGPVGVVFQSGGNLQFFMQTAADRGLTFSYGVSTGNEPDLDLADYVDYMVDDPETRTIVLFIEGIRRPPAFMRAAGKALAAGKPILAIKTGQSQLSQEAAKSHTGAIAGDYASFLAMCDRYGIVCVESMEDLVETALAFQCGRRPKGPKIGFVTTSGGTVDLLYDYAETEGSVLANFSDTTKAALEKTMQEGIKAKNPLDVGIPSTNEAAANWCRIVHNETDVDMVGYSTQLPRREGYGDFAPFEKLLAETDKPIICFGRMIHQVTPDIVARQRSAGMPFLQGLQPTLRAMNALWFHAKRQGRAPAALPEPKPSTLDETSLGKALESHGIRLPQSRVSATPADAAKAAADIGFPVALKIQSADILHKTEAGGVMLGLATPEQVEAAAKQLVTSAKRAYPNARIDGVLVQEMVSGIEAIVGVREDPLYGPMLLVGSGGILVELAQDAQLSLLPVGDAQVSGMIDKLKLASLLAGYRGRPAADRAALERTTVALARFFLEHRAKIRDIEINPLMVLPDGRGAVAVDVRVIWK
jgi:acetyltransferase